jgi:hypothetical protein
MFLCDHGLIEFPSDIFVAGAVGDEAIELCLFSADAVLHIR